MNLCISFARHRAIRTLSILMLLAVAISFSHPGLPWDRGFARKASAQKLDKSSVIARTEGATKPSLGTGTCDSAVIDVEAAGMTTAYTSLAGAFAGINAAVHTGDIVIEICGDASHSGSAVLNSSGAGAANYTSVVIRPLTDGATISGTTVAGRGVIELNGADNVTIDGDNPLTEGINRNLTIQNTAPNTVANTSVIRIALHPTNVPTADNNTFKNLKIVGNATGLNIASATGSASPANQSFGIAASGAANGAATSPNNLSTTTTVGSPATAANLLIENNEVISVARGIAIQGSGADVFHGLIISSNMIGNSVEGDPDQVYMAAVTIQGSTDALVSFNTVYVESYISISDAGGIRGLDHGLLSLSSSGLGTRFDSNKILRVKSNNPNSRGASGITVSRGNSHWVVNNFITGVINNHSSAGGFLPTQSAMGIRTVTTSSGHRIYHNSVHMHGVVTGTSPSNITAAFGVSVSGNNGLDVRNNIFSNQLSGGDANTRHAVIYLPSGLNSSFNSIFDNNAYFEGSSPNSRLAQVGTTAGSGEYMASDFDPTQTTPASNFRSYTSSLISPAAHLNDIASFASMAPPPFVSDTDLHLTGLNGSQIDGGGADAGVAADIDGDARGAEPDIGADEHAAPTAAEARVAGRVATAGGRGVSGARVRLSGGGGQAVYAVTNPFGYYRFAGLTAGETYVVEVSAKRYTFAEPVRVVTLFDSVDDLDFVADQW